MCWLKNQSRPTMRSKSLFLYPTVMDSCKNASLVRALTLDGSTQTRRWNRKRCSCRSNRSPRMPLSKYFYFSDWNCALWVGMRMLSRFSLLLIARWMYQTSRTSSAKCLWLTSKAVSFSTHSLTQKWPSTRVTPGFTASGGAGSKMRQQLRKCASIWNNTLWIRCMLGTVCSTIWTCSGSSMSTALTPTIMRTSTLRIHCSGSHVNRRSSRTSPVSIWMPRFKRTSTHR